MAFELPNADFAGQLGGGGRVALQGEGTVQGLPVTAPHAGEWHLLQGNGGTKRSMVCRAWLRWVANRRDLIAIIMRMMTVIAAEIIA